MTLWFIEYTCGTIENFTRENIYIIFSQLWKFPINSKYHPMYFKKIETHNPFAYFIFYVNSMHLMKITEVFIFPQTFFKEYKKLYLTIITDIK